MLITWLSGHILPYFNLAN